MDFRILVIEEGDTNYAVYELCDGEVFNSLHPPKVNQKAGS